MAPVLPLFFIIFLEGYIVLSTELLAIRLLLPFTGGGTDTVSIIIAAVLLPLAFGYFAGGRFKAAPTGTQKRRTIRGKLVSNLTVAGFILTVGLSYVLLEKTFIAFQEFTGWYNRIVFTAVYCALFIVYPVYLLGQTVPLVSNYFSREKMSRAAGQILFFSTMGSFMGAVFGTLVLMARLGVHHTVSITIGCMALLVFILARKKLSTPVMEIMTCLAAALILNSADMMQYLHVVSNNQYNTAQIFEDDALGIRMLRLNRSFSSVVYKDKPDTFSQYMAFMEKNFINPQPDPAREKSILMLGAGAFALGRTDTMNKYIFVDIDPALKHITENDFLHQPLPPNKTFVAMDARAYLIQSKEKFDLIITDLFRDPISVPENLTTLDFFLELKKHLKPGGVFVGNFSASPGFTDLYSRRLDNTLRAAFPYINRQVIPDFNIWKRDNDWVNIVYSYVDLPNATDTTLYTDDKNTSAFDRPVSLKR